MSMNPEKSRAVMDFSPSSQEEIKEEHEKGLINLEQMMTKVFTGETDGAINKTAQTPEETSLPVELVANPPEMENPPEEDDENIRDETGLSWGFSSVAPTEEKPPIYEVGMVETPIVAATTTAVNSDELNFNLQPENDLPAMPEEQTQESEAPAASKVEVIAEENPVVVETVKEEPAKEELIVEEDELSARRAARAQSKQMYELSRIDAQLLAAQIKRDQFEQLENRKAA